jgi:hypothetical protein
VREAFEHAEQGDFAALISFGINIDFLAVKKLFAMADDRAVPSYVRMRALQIALKYKEAAEFRVPEKATAIEDLERLLQQQCGEKPDSAAPVGNHRSDLRDDLDLEFTLD